MNISHTQNTQSIRYNELRNRLQELSNNQLSANLSVSSNSNSECTSKRTYEDLQSGCYGDDNIMYMLTGLVNSLIDQKNIYIKITRCWIKITNYVMCIVVF